MDVRNKYAAGLFFLLTIVAVQCAYSSGMDESVENASLLSKILDGNDTMNLTQASEYSAENRSVNIDVDHSPEEAKKLCSEISAIVEYHDLVFAPGWTVQMTTPSTDGAVIAVCPL
ncbi:hypothetical protein ACEN9D_19010 [Pseudomonas sp. CT11-2]|jgi:hypothetical protein|uniref:hypothetical protein n=1 Tax=Pseudomonas TaxID=286 RepID=UPI00036F18C4|nr:MULTISPECIES: hypothetical protein [Pseudomonas]UVM34860.1 hypothetical protein LOY36_09190 [Pseudomonas sp. B21-019]